jgi:hypothetical protein
VADFLQQVGYREYSRYLSFHFPFTHERSLREHLRAVPWKFDQRLFKVRVRGGPSQKRKDGQKTSLTQLGQEKKREEHIPGTASFPARKGGGRERGRSGEGVEGKARADGRDPG